MAEESTMPPCEGEHRRESLPITRTHQRFLLRELHFTQQFASMYYHRLSVLQPRALERFHRYSEKRLSETAVDPQANLVQLRRVLELAVGERALCIGTVFKHMKGYRRFLDEYQKELVRIEMGGDDGEGGEGDGEGMGAGDGEELGILGDIALSSDLAPGMAVDSSALTGNYCTEADVALLEDDSGRVELSNFPVQRYVTGMVIFAVGTLREKGKFEVEQVSLCGPAPQTPLRNPLSSSVPVVPKYLAFVSGLSVGYNGAAAAGIDLLVDFLGGNIGDDRMVRLAASVARLVVGGNSIDTCDELKLKYKVKLDPSDHVRVTDTASVNTAANCMRELDRVLASLADTIDVDFLPGEQDPSNSFLPQQPLHPILLREAAKRSTLRLVTNPYEFCVSAPGDNNTPATVFVSSGSTVDDMLRQSNYASPLDAMTAALECGLACPTAPNTVPCYPFQDSDPFIFPSTPHVFVCCNQPAFSTRYAQIARGGSSKSGSEPSTRLITVPSFALSGTLVLVDMNDPELRATSVQLL